MAETSMMVPNENEHKIQKDTTTQKYIIKLFFKDQERYLKTP